MVANNKKIGRQKQTRTAVRLHRNVASFGERVWELPAIRDAGCAAAEAADKPAALLCRPFPAQSIPFRAERAAAPRPP
jgi:hypothetical protein